MWNWYLFHVHFENIILNQCWVLMVLFILFYCNVDISIKTELAVLTIRPSSHVSELSVTIFRWWKKVSEIPNSKPSSTWLIQTGLSCHFACQHIMPKCNTNIHQKKLNSCMSEAVDVAQNRLCGGYCWCRALRNQRCMPETMTVISEK